MSVKLFAFYVGGYTETSHVEVHDMRFAFGERIEDCFGSLREQWWGSAKSLHIDCWSELTSADEHRISLRQEKSSNSKRLFFLNLGGYDPAQFTELHENVFVVALDEEAAKKRALAMIKKWWRPHRDTSFEVEHIVGLSEIAVDAGMHLHLESAPGIKPPTFVTGLYLLLNA